MIYVDVKNNRARWEMDGGKVRVSSDGGHHWNDSTMTRQDIQYMVDNKLVYPINSKSKK